ncbi:MAG: acyltransferase [Candidatus Nanopelagicales bacterium]|nr:acyltransferase [Candidatus Nanopelagicales bacterium]
MGVFIRQLTGIRAVAAVWVLFYHLQGPLDTLGVMSIPVLSDVIRVGRLGVDLFFALSGFILTHTYLRKLGPKAHARPTLEFWWLRLARIYPVHFVMLNAAGLAVVAQALITGENKDRPWLNPIDYIRNLLLIQEWGPNPERGWNVVAWSLSMEWLAYLLFPVVVLALFFFHRRINTPLLLAAWVVSILPLLLRASVGDDPYYGGAWGSTIRVLTAFVAGAITYLIVIRLINSDGSISTRTERLATTVSVAMPLVVIAGATFLGRWSGAQPEILLIDPDAEPLPPFFHLWLVPPLIVWIGALALSKSGQVKFLSRETVVLGGLISYSLYMTHLVWLSTWRAGMNAIGLESGPLYALSVVFALAMAFVLAWLMWRLVEEPARRFMRRGVGVRPVAPEETAADKTTG